MTILKKYPLIFVSLFFAGMTFLFTFPLGIHFGSQLPKGGGDTFQALSNIDLHLKILEGAGFFVGLKLFLGKLGTYSPYVLLNLLLNKYAAYNTMFFLSYILSGLGAYLLAYHFTERKDASLVAGVLFAYAPFHYYQTVAVHLGSMQQQWIPFAALFLLKFLDELKFKDYALFLFFLLMLAISEHQLLAFSLLFFLVLVSVRIWQNKQLLKNRKLWLCLGGSLIFFAFIAVFVFGDMLKVATSAENFLDPGSGAAKKYAMNAWEPLLPPSFHALWPGINEWLRKTAKISADGRDSYFVGFSSLILLGFFAWKKMRKKNKLILEKAEKADLNLWLVAFFTMFVFSWGPGFKIFNIDFPLPYYLIYEYLPFYGNIRVTGRMFMFAMLAFAILVALAVKYLQPMLKDGFWKRNFAFVLVVVLMLEFLVFPVRTMSLAYSPFYDRIAKEQGAFKILEIPGSTDYEFASYKLFTNNVHGKQSLDGMPLARKISGQFDMQQGTPVIKQLLYTIPKGNDPDEGGKEDIFTPFDFANSNDVLNYYNVGYITISKIYAKEDVLELSKKFIEKHVFFEDKYEDEYLVAYKITKKTPNGIFVEMKNDNSQFSKFHVEKDGSGWREMGDGAVLRVVNMGNSVQKVKITIGARSAAGLVFSSPSDEASGKLVLSDDPQTYSFFANLQPGENKVSFSVKDVAGEPVKSSNKKKNPSGIIVSKIDILAQ